MIEINEIFYSIQGEGHYVGAPAIFVRVQGCNLKCTFCDTKNAQDKDIKHTSLKWYNSDLSGQWYTSDLSSYIVKMIIDKKCDYIVFTGGEPLLLGENLGDLIYLIEEEIKCQIGIDKASQLHYGIETNGTLSLLECAIKPYIWKQVSICLSPKYENGNPRYIDSSFYSHCINEKNNFKRVSLKLLLPFYLRYGEEYSALRFDDYYVQPLVVDQSQHTWDSIYRLTCQSVIEDLSKFGTMWRLSVQLNKLLGVKRGDYLFD